MLRPSPNHGTQRLPNDDDEMMSKFTLCVRMYVRKYVSRRLCVFMYSVCMYRVYVCMMYATTSKFHVLATGNKPSLYLSLYYYK